MSHKNPKNERMRQDLNKLEKGGDDLNKVEK